MGLDIVGYSNLKFTGEREYDRSGGHDDMDYVFVENTAFPDRLAEMSTGYYEQTAETESHDFRAGSYSSYGYWRNQLCQKIYGVPAETLWNNYEVYIGQPFAELIMMSDCEGSIGTKVCEKLYQDFLKYREVLVEMEANEWTKYVDNWTEAFRLGSQNGVVVFT